MKTFVLDTGSLRGAPGDRILAWHDGTLVVFKGGWICLIALGVILTLFALRGYIE